MTLPMNRIYTVMYGKGDPFNLEYTVLVSIVSFRLSQPYIGILRIVSALFYAVSQTMF